MVHLLKRIWSFGNLNKLILPLCVLEQPAATRFLTISSRSLKSAANLNGHVVSQSHYSITEVNGLLSK